MTSQRDSTILESYVPVYDVIPERWEDARAVIVEQLKKISNAVNLREIGWLLDEELLSGKAFIPGVARTDPSITSQNYRAVLRKVIDFGALPNTATKTVPHGISFTNNFTLVDLWGASTDPTGLLAIPLPFVPITAGAPAGNINLVMTSTNISVTTGSNRSNFTRTFIVAEFLQEL